jgi:hypothetical protein
MQPDCQLLRRPFEDPLKTDYRSLPLTCRTCRSSIVTDGSKRLVRRTLVRNVVDYDRGASTSQPLGDGATNPAGAPTTIATFLLNAYLC